MTDTASMTDTATTATGAAAGDRDPIRGVMVPILTPLTPAGEADTGSLR